MRIRKVAVLGAGTMGSRIAAHFANAGIQVRLLDLLDDGADRNAIAKKGIETALSHRPSAFFAGVGTQLIEAGNFDDDLPRLADCQWIIEGVVENLEIKRVLWSKVALHRDAGAIVSTNTSGIRLAEISRDFRADFQQHFLGTHFFNPPRYLHLFELIPGPATDPKILSFVQHFAESVLGKGVVFCKDTPNFVANRIGSFLGAAVHRAMLEFDFSIEEVDALTGPLIGVPKSATFRLLDIVGLDIWHHVSRNLYEAASDDPWREWFVAPPFMAKMVENGWLGEKRGQGFYKRVGPHKEIHVLDWKTLRVSAGQKTKVRKRRSNETDHRFRRTSARLDLSRRSSRPLPLERAAFVL